jgi:hypothetical protein
MTAAIEESRARLPHTALGGLIASRTLLGPLLVTKLVHDYALDHVVHPKSSSCPIDMADTPAMFDPLRCGEINERVAGSDFVNLRNAHWRRVPHAQGARSAQRQLP